MSPNEIYSSLSEQLIDNKYGVLPARSEVARHEETDMHDTGTGQNLNPTSFKLKLNVGEVTQ